MQLFRSHPGAAFRREADRIEAQTFRRVVQFLLNYRADILYRDPEAAIAFSLAAVRFSRREMVLMETITDLCSPLLPNSDDQMVEEPTNMVLKYLRCERVVAVAIPTLLPKTKSPEPSSGLEERQTEP